MCYEFLCLLNVVISTNKEMYKKYAVQFRTPHDILRLYGLYVNHTECQSKCVINTFIVHNNRVH